MVFTSRTRAVVEIPFRTVLAVVSDARILAAKKRIPIKSARNAFLYIVVRKEIKIFGYLYLFHDD